VTDYRRYFVPGGTYFFTATVADRSLPLLTDNISALRAAFRHVRAELPFAVDAIVVLPDHLHTIWVLPPGDADFSTRWKKIKATFSASYQDRAPSESRTRKGERGIWQRRFWEQGTRPAR
jgi:putative transposase